MEKKQILTTIYIPPEIVVSILFQDKSPIKQFLKNILLRNLQINLLNLKARILKLEI